MKVFAAVIRIVRLRVVVAVNSVAALPDDRLVQQEIADRSPMVSLPRAISRHELIDRSFFGNALASPIPYEGASAARRPSPRKRSMSFIGALPKKRPYSRVNCEALE